MDEHTLFFVHSVLKHSSTRVPGGVHLYRVCTISFGSSGTSYFSMCVECGAYDDGGHKQKKTVPGGQSLRLSVVSQ